MGRIPGAIESVTKTDLPLTGKRILIAKPGLDGHDIGAKVIALALREAGAEVFYTGIRKSPAFITKMALEESVDVIGISLLSGSHCELMKDVVVELAKSGASNIPVVLGGTIPREDHPFLQNLGIRGIFTSDMELDEITSRLVEILE
jgi:methylmalonyl-CoA mutase C-terminal domain/subunit